MRCREVRRIVDFLCTPEGLDWLRENDVRLGIALGYGAEDARRFPDFETSGIHDTVNEIAMALPPDAVRPAHHTRYDSEQTGLIANQEFDDAFAITELLKVGHDRVAAAHPGITFLYVQAMDRLYEA